MIASGPQSGASPNRSPYWPPATGTQHLGSTWLVAILALQAHSPWSFPSWSLILVPDTSYFHSQNKPRGFSVEWRKGMVVKAGGEGCTEEAVAQDRKLGFSLALCPGHPELPKRNTTRVVILTTMERRLVLRNCAHFSLENPKLETNLGVRPHPTRNPAPSTSTS